MRLAKIKTKNQSYADAASIYQVILSKFPKNVEAQKELKKIRETTTTGTVGGPTLPPSAQQHLVSLYTSGQHKQAIQKAIALLNDFPKSSFLYNIIGAIYQAHDEFAQATSAFQKAVENNPNFVDAFYNLGICHYQQNNYEAAFEAYNRAKNIKPNHPGLDNNFGLCLQKLGKMEEAIKSYKSALKLNPTDRDALWNLGNLCEETGDVNSAIKLFDQAKTQKAVARALECTYIQGDIDEFNKRLNSISTSDPTNIRVAAMSAFAAQQIPQLDPYPFCKNPLEMLHFSNVKNHIKDSDRFITEVLDEMNNKKAVWEPSAVTTKGGFQTGSRLFNNPSENLSRLHSAIKSELLEFKSKFSDKSCSLIDDWPANFNITAWYVRLLQNGHQDSHIHPTGWVSGVVYLKTVDNPQNNEGAIKFSLRGYDYPNTDTNCPQKLFQPNKGDIVLFPSSLFHETVPVIADVERCVIAFDLVRSV